MGSGASQACAQAPGAQAPAEIWSLLLNGPHTWMICEIFSFLPWKQSLNLLCASKGLRAFCKPEDLSGAFWRWLCLCVAEQSLLYLPTEDDLHLLAAGDYRAFAQELAFLNCSGRVERFRVSTFCRVRPPRGDEKEMQTTVVQLPLNQRVVLLQQKEPQLSRAAAMKMLINKECGAGQPLQEIVNNHQDEETVNLEDGDGKDGKAGNGQDGNEGERDKKNEENEENENEKKAYPASPTAEGSFTASILNVTPGIKGSILTVSPGIGLRNWDFECVFDQQAASSEVHGRCGLRLAVSLVNGRSGALVVYGQTGSGKTHTMFGEGQDGLVASVARDVLRGLNSARRTAFEMQLGVSYVEVFGNDITNLLGGAGGGALGVNRGQSQRMGHKYVLEGRCEEPVEDMKSFQELLSCGNERKRKASTEMNERSTRAHALVIFRLRQRSKKTGEELESRLFLADLGGSEKVSKSKANENLCAPGGVNVGDEEVSRVTWQEYYRCRERITETNHINKGLLTLKRCVQALNNRQSSKDQARVPFNDSKLTMLLQPALTGEAVTSVVVCCAPEKLHAEETVQSLRFAELCSAVESSRSGAQDVTQAVRQTLQRIDEEIRALESEILKKERWEWRKTTRKHVVNELSDMVICNKDEEMELGGRGTVEFKADDGSSVQHTTEHDVWGQVLVGAEEENARRDELIKTRMRLLGEQS